MATRHERVVLELQDNFTTGMAKAATATATLDRALDGLDGSTTRVNKSTSVTAVQSDRSSKAFGRQADSINRLTGRLRLLGDVLAVFGPTLSPIAAGSVAGLGGLVNLFSAGALGAGSMLAAFQGVGGALEAVNKAALEPTVDNIEAADKAMRGLTPAARDAVDAMRGLVPVLRQIRDTGAENLFPGLVDMLDSLESRAPDLERIVGSMNAAMGDLLSSAGSNLASGEWDEFFDFLATDAKDSLVDLGVIVGEFSAGLAGLWMAFDPLNDDISRGLRNAATDFHAWADALDEIQGFRDFVAYVRESGPELLDTLGAIGGMFIDIGVAASPIAGPVMKGLEAFADVVSAIAKSDVGTPLMVGVAALSAFNRTAAITAGLATRMGQGGLMGMFFGGAKANAKAGLNSFSGIRADIAAMSDRMVAFGANVEKADAAAKRMHERMVGLGKVAGPMAGIGIAASGMADGFALSNTASMALLGTMAGPLGAALGGTTGLVMDLVSKSKEAAQATEEFTATLDAQTGALTANSYAWGLDSLGPDLVAKLDAAGIALNDFFDAAARGDDMDAFFSGVDMDLSHDEINRLGGTVNALADGHEKGAQAAENHARATGMTADAAGLSAGALAGEAGALTNVIQLLRDAHDQRLRAANADLNLRQTMADSAAKVKENGQAWRDGTQAARDNERELLNFAGAWKQLNSEQEVSPGRTRRTRAAFKELATEITGSEKAAERLAQELFDIPRDVNIKAKLDAGGVRTELQGLDNFQFRTKYIRVHTRRTSEGDGVDFHSGGGLTRGSGGGMGGGMAGGTPAIGGGIAAVVALGRQTIKSLTASLDEAIDKRDRTRARREATGAAASSHFTGSLWGQESSAWADGTGGARGTIRDRIAGLRERMKYIRRLRGMGIRGKAFQELMNASNEELRELFASGEMREWVKDFKTYDRLVGSVESSSGNAAWGKALREQNRHVREIKAELRGMRKDAKNRGKSNSKQGKKNTGAIVAASGGAVRKAALKSGSWAA